LYIVYIRLYTIKETYLLLRFVKKNRRKSKLSVKGEFFDFKYLKYFTATSNFVAGCPLSLLLETGINTWNQVNCKCQRNVCKYSGDTEHHTVIFEIITKLVTKIWSYGLCDGGPFSEGKAKGGEGHQLPPSIFRGNNELCCTPLPHMTLSVYRKTLPSSSDL
jgi:hypothetical protein